MNEHPSEEDLMLHFYGEDPLADERRVDEHLAACVACRDAWIELVELLKLVDSATVPEPDSGFERVMWARIQPALPARRAAWRAWPRVLAPVAGLAAVVVAGVVSWQVLTPRRAPVTTSPAAVAATQAGDARRARERVLFAALDGHFEETQLLLTELMNAPESGASDFSFARTTAGDLVASGRLYRATAQRDGDLQLVGTLDDLEAVLVDVARTPDRMDQADLQSLRARIDGASLLFKVRAVANEIRERQKTLVTE
jgi:hypothetical protein